MRIVTLERIAGYIKEFAVASGALIHWLDVAKIAEWEHLEDIREVFPSADGVEVNSGAIVIVFNLKNNDYRLIASIKYQVPGDEKRKGKVNVHYFMTHAEYDKNKWKRTL